MPGSYNSAAQDTNASDFSAVYDTLLIKDAGGTTLVSFSISWNAASGGQVTVSGTPVTASASATGTADNAEFQNSGGSEAITGFSVGTSGTDVTLNTTSIESGKDVDLQSGTYTAPTSTA